MSQQDLNDLTKLERLAALVRDDGLDPRTMDAYQLSQYLKDRKVDMTGPRKRFEALLKKAKGKQQLERAHQKRLEQEAHQGGKGLLAAGAEAAEAVRERVRSMIEKLKRLNPEEAQVYAREFEKATSEDLASLEKDLKLLEEDDRPDDPGNQ